MVVKLLFFKLSFITKGDSGIVRLSSLLFRMSMKSIAGIIIFYINYSSSPVQLSSSQCTSGKTKLEFYTSPSKVPIKIAFSAFLLSLFTFGKTLQLKFRKQLQANSIASSELLLGSAHKRPGTVHCAYVICETICLSFNLAFHGEVFYCISELLKAHLCFLFAWKGRNWLSALFR